MKKEDESFEEFQRKELERLREENKQLREQIRERGENPETFLTALRALRNRLTR